MIDVPARPQLKSDLNVSDIADYSQSLKEASEHWFKTWNPTLADCSPIEAQWLERLNHIGIGYFRPLVMSAFASKQVAPDERVSVLQEIERFIFLAFRVSQARSNYGSSEFYNASRQLYYKEMTISEIIKLLKNRTAYLFDSAGVFKPAAFIEFMANKFEHGSKNGFYGWSGLRYFLYEYEQSLFDQAKSQTAKISWSKFINDEDLWTIEHILPQTPTLACWQKHFQAFPETQLRALTNTLGNLLPLSQPKNSSLRNICYAEKRADKNNARGYFNGSYSENLVAEKYEDWTPQAIKERGLALLAFMEKRWAISLGDETTKLRLLHIDFL